MQCVGWLCLGLALWAILVPVRLFFTWWGIQPRGVWLGVVLVCIVGGALGFDVPGRWMQAVERAEQARVGAAGEARRNRARARQEALDGRAAPRGGGRSPEAGRQSKEDRRREAAAAARARARYETELRRLEQSGTRRANERQQRR